MRSVAMPTFADAVFRPTHRSSEILRDVCLVIGGSLLMVVSAKVRIGGPIPFTMQPWAAVLLGVGLGSRRGGLALLAYLAEGLAGLPVFAGPTAGPAYLFGPTGGYLVGFVVAAFVSGRLAECGWDRRFLTALAALAIGDAIIFASGVAWLATFQGVRAAFAVGVLPFLAVDALKVLLAAAALPGAWRLLGRTSDLRN